MASPLQTIREIRATVAAATWPDGAASQVIGANAAMITAGVEDDQDLPDRLPFALINLGAQTADEDDPGLVTQEIVLVLAASVPGHNMGEYSLIGGASGESGRWGYSTNRGLLEVETVIIAAVQRLNGADGAPIEVKYGSASAPQRLKDKAVVFRQYTLSAVCTRADEYPAPQNLVVGTPLVGQIPLTWDLPASRFDLSSIVLRYATGATAPATIADGTDGGVSTLATSKTIIGLAANTYSVSVFGKYQDTNASDLRYSDPLSRTSVVVT